MDRRVFSNDDAGTAMRVLTIVWASCVAIDFVVWALVAMTTGELVHPWWIWVAGPPGAVLGRPLRGGDQSCPIVIRRRLPAPVPHH